MPVLPPGLGIMGWLGSEPDPTKTWEQLPFYDRLKAMAKLDLESPQDKALPLGEKLGRMAGQALPWVPGGMGDTAYYNTPASQEYDKLPALAKLGRVAGMGLQMRGGIGAPFEKRSWLRNPNPVNEAGEAQRVSVTPEMVAQAKAGDEAARAKVVDGLQDMAAKAANRYAKPGRTEFDDLMGEANVAIIDVLDNKNPQAFLPYVQGAIDRRLQNYTRGQTRAGKRQASSDFLSTVEDPSARIPDVPRKEMNAILNKAMEKLSDKQRQVVEARLGLNESLPEGATTERISEIMGVSRQATEKNLRAGLAKLHDELKAAGIEPTDLVPDTTTPPPTRQTPINEGVKPTSTEPIVPGPSGGAPAKAVWANYQEGLNRPELGLNTEGFHNYHLTEDFRHPQSGLVYPKGTTQSEAFLKENGIPYEPPPPPGTPPVYEVPGLLQQERPLRSISGGSTNELTPLGEGLSGMYHRFKNTGGYMPKAGPSSNYEMIAEPYAGTATADTLSVPDFHGTVANPPDVRTNPNALREYMRMIYEMHPEHLENY